LLFFVEQPDASLVGRYLLKVVKNFTNISSQMLRKLPGDGVADFCKMFLQGRSQWNKSLLWRKFARTEAVILVILLKSYLPYERRNQVTGVQKPD
jgi:hypothetical protein